MLMGWGGQEKILELMKAVDEYIPMPPRDHDKPFLMPVHSHAATRPRQALPHAGQANSDEPFLK